MPVSLNPSGHGPPYQKEPVPANMLSQLARPMTSVRPNAMEYVDDEGEQRRIYLPRGTSKAASRYLQEKRWDLLAKFPKYENQGYTEEDHIRGPPGEEPAPEPQYEHLIDDQDSAEPEKPAAGS